MKIVNRSMYIGQKVYDMIHRLSFADNGDEFINEIDNTLNEIFKEPSPDISKELIASLVATLIVDLKLVSNGQPPSNGVTLVMSKQYVDSLKKPDNDT